MRKILNQKENMKKTNMRKILSLKEHTKKKTKKKQNKLI